MKLKCNINNKEYDIVQGATFSEEYNETLDSGSIILTHVKRIKDLRRFDDVFIYSTENGHGFNGYSYKNYNRNLPITLKSTSITTETDTITIDGAEALRFELVKDEYSNTNSIKYYNRIDNLYYEKSDFQKQYPDYKNNGEGTFLGSGGYPTLYILDYTQLEDIVGFEGKAHWIETSTSNIETFYLDSRTTSNDVITSIYKNNSRTMTVVSNTNTKNTSVSFTNSSRTYNLKYTTFYIGRKDDATYDDLIKEYYSFGQQSATGIYEAQWENENQQTVIERYYLYIDGVIQKSRKIGDEEEKTISVNFCNVSLLNLNKTIFEIAGSDIGNMFTDDYSGSNIITFKVWYDQLGIDTKLYSYELVDNKGIGAPYFLIGKDDKLRIDLFREPSHVGVTYNLTFDNRDFLVNAMKIELVQAQFNYFSKKIAPNIFYKHLLLDSYTEKIINLDEDICEYNISLCSETKGLEAVVCPNISITQPLNQKKKRSIWDYLNQFVNYYSPKYKVAINDEEWEYRQKYTLSNELQSIFKNTFSPDFTLNLPTLRDLISQLMIVKDMIPYVEDGYIKGIDITKINGNFNKKNINFIQGKLNGEGYCDSLRRTYNGSLLSDNSTHMVEYLGFRNSNTALMTINNMQLETSFPIYKINKIYLCYYKKGLARGTSTSGKTLDKEIQFLCKQDITGLVRLSQERAMLSLDWSKMKSIDFSALSLEQTIEVLSQYQMGTFEYNINSNIISGFGQKYNYASNFWNDPSIKGSYFFDYTQTYIENIASILDNKNPYGIYDENYMITFINQNTGDDYTWSFSTFNSGNLLDDRLVTPITSTSAKLKSFFFLVDYDGFYNGAIIHSKNNGIDNITINDNSSSSLTLVEKDGLFQNEKVNRLGNKNYSIPARYDKEEDYIQNNKFDIQKLGSELSFDGEDNIIVYHREYSIYDNYVNAIYYASHDYVQKNYFTSVYAKHRTWSLMSYNESINRAENKRQILLLSTKDLFYEDPNNNTFTFNNFEGKDQTSGYYRELFSFFRPSEKKETKNYLYNENKLNYGIVVINNECYTADISSFVSGYSLCFNIKMFDNASMGVNIKNIETLNTNVLFSIWDKLDFKGFIDYIKSGAFFDGLGRVKDDYCGSSQEWALTVDDSETGFVNKIGIYFSQIDQRQEFLDSNVRILKKSKSVRQIYNSYIFEYPHLSQLVFDNGNFSFKKDVFSTIKNTIGNVFAINKDNKEKIDMTFQFDPMTNDNDIVFSQWLMKLSDLASDYNKVDEDYYIKNLEATTSINLYLTNVKIYNHGRMPVMILNLTSEQYTSITTNSKIISPLFLYNSYERTVWTDTVMSFGEYVFKMSFQILSVIEKKQNNNDKLDYIRFNCKITYTYVTLDRTEEITKTITQPITFYRGGTKSEFEINKTYFDDESVGDINGKPTYYAVVEQIDNNFFWRYKIDSDTTEAKRGGMGLENGIGRMPFDFVDFKLKRLESIGLDSRTSYEIQTFNIKNSKDDTKTKIEKNMFIVYSNNYVSKSLVYDEYTDLASASIGTVQNIKVSDIFKFEENKIRVKIPTSGAYKSIQYWYKDNETYHLVFGVNLTDKERMSNEEYKDIYISAIDSRDQRVYNEDHILIGRVYNYLTDNEEVEEQDKKKYGIKQYYFKTLEEN